MGAGVTEQALSERSSTVKLSHHTLRQTDKEAIKHRAVKRFLVMKVVIQQCLIDASGRGDGIHAGTRQTFLCELGQRCLQDGIAAGFRLMASTTPRSDKFGLLRHV